MSYKNIAKTASSISQPTFTFFLYNSKMIINFVAAVSVFFVSVAVFLKVYLSKKRQILNINEKFVFITGCDAGFGQQATIALDALGFHVFAACFTREGEYHLQTVCSNRVRTLRLDVTEHESIEDAYSKVTEVLPSNTGKRSITTTQQNVHLNDFVVFVEFWLG